MFVGAQVEKVKAEVAALGNNLQALVLEGLNNVAFSGGLANPLIAPEHSLGNLSADTLTAFVKVSL